MCREPAVLQQQRESPEQVGSPCLPHEEVPLRRTQRRDRCGVQQRLDDEVAAAHHGDFSTQVGERLHRVVELAVGELAAIAAVDQVGHHLEAALAVNVVVERLLGQVQAGAGLAHRREHGGRRRDIAGEDDPPRYGGLVHPPDAIVGRADQRDGAFCRVVNRGRHHGVGPVGADDVDRRVLEVDRPRHAVDRARDEVDQRQFVGQEPPAAADEPGAQRALARAGWRREDRCPPAFFDHGGVDDQELVRVRCDAPVEAPLQHRVRLAKRQRPERGPIVEVEEDLRSDPAPQASRGGDADVEVGEIVRRSERELAVHPRNGVRHRGQRRADAGGERREAKQELAAGEPVREVRRAEGGEFQRGRRRPCQARAILPERSPSARGRRPPGRSRSRRPSAAASSSEVFGPVSSRRRTSVERGSRRWVSPDRTVVRNDSPRPTRRIDEATQMRHCQRADGPRVHHSCTVPRPNVPSLTT